MDGSTSLDSEGFQKGVADVARQLMVAGNRSAAAAS